MNDGDGPVTAKQKGSGVARHQLERQIRADRKKFLEVQADAISLVIAVDGLRYVVEAMMTPLAGYLAEHAMSRLADKIPGDCPCMLCREAREAISEHDRVIGVARQQGVIR